MLFVIFRGRYRTQNSKQEIDFSPPSGCERIFLCVMLVVLQFFFLPSQFAQAQSAPAPVATTPSIPPTPTSIPVTDISNQVELASGELEDISSALSTDPVTTRISDQLPPLVTEINARVSEASGILASNASLDTLHDLEVGLTALSTEVSTHEHALTARSNELQRELTTVAAISTRWTATLQASKQAGLPPEVLKTMQDIVDRSAQVKHDLDTHENQILTLSTQLSGQDTRITEKLKSIQRATEGAIGNLLSRDSTAIWNIFSTSDAGFQPFRAGKIAIDTQIVTLLSFMHRETGTLIIHLLLFLVILGFCFYARQRIHVWAEGDVEVVDAWRIVEAPIATAIVLALLLSRILYPQPPHIFRSLIGVSAAIPMVIVLRKLVDRDLFRILNAIVLFFFFDQLRAAAESEPLAVRLLLLFEMACGIAFCLWLNKYPLSSQPTTNAATKPNPVALSSTEMIEARRSKILIGSRLAFAVFATAAVAGILGYENLALLLGNATLQSVYVGLLLYASLQVGECLLMSALNSPPLSLFHAVQNRRRFMWRRVVSIARWLTALWWFWIVLDLFSIRTEVVSEAEDILLAKITFGSISFSLGNIAAFGLTVWGTIILSRVVRFFLDEEIYPKLNLERGLPYAISTITHYALLVTGLFFALAAFGYDLTKLTVLAGAVGVGLGFGMQNIASNFISGIILLFERPIKVGDEIQVGDTSGEVSHIGIRSSVMRMKNGIEMIIPNGKLISDPVMNWTFSAQRRLIELDVGVAYGTNPQRVLEILKNIATTNPQVLKEASPQAVVSKLGPGALGFTLQVWVNSAAPWMQIRSELAIAINDALVQEKIQVV